MWSRLCIFALSFLQPPTGSWEINDRASFCDGLHMIEGDVNLSAGQGGESSPVRGLVCQRRVSCFMSSWENCPIFWPQITSPLPFFLPPMPRLAGFITTSLHLTPRIYLGGLSLSLWLWRKRRQSVWGRKKTYRRQKDHTDIETLFTSVFMYQHMLRRHESSNIALCVNMHDVLLCL